jgi:hypothetical protein
MLTTAIIKHAYNTVSETTPDGRLYFFVSQGAADLVTKNTSVERRHNIPIDFSLTCD